ncbi:MFS general substrate transporter [Wallemia mellicola]|nr:MFS general substrate transporter [Wallemia mellicola]
MATQAKRFQELDATTTPVDEKTSATQPSSSNDHSNELYFEKKSAEGKIELTEDAAPECVGVSFSSKKKWAILTVIVIVQYSMNYNAAIYANAVDGMTEEWGISSQAARVGQMIFLVAYAFGCELWAPWSEEYGRWPILQLSLFLVNCWALLCSLAPNFGSMVVGRFLGGISSAGGSVTLGLVADLFTPETQQYGLAYVVWSSVGGSVLGPILGGFIQQFAKPEPAWRWVFWTQLIFGGFAQILHWTIPETRSSILLDKEAKRRRKQAAKEGEELNIWGPNEISKRGLSFREVLVIWYRPFEMFLREPIVLSCSLLSGFSDMLIFIFLDAFNPVYSQWGFQPFGIALAFIPIAIAYCLGWVSFLPFFRKSELRRKRGEIVPPEERLYWLLWTAPLEAIGLFGFAWTSMGPEHNHWFGPMFFSALIGIANYAIYMATIDYMVAAYGPYSSSATGGNGFARDLLAGIAAMYAGPFYEHFPNYTLEYPSTILACMAVVLIIPIHLLYFYGPEVRRRSKFAQTLASERETTQIRHQVRDEKSKVSQHIEHAA